MHPSLTEPNYTASKVLLFIHKSIDNYSAEEVA